MGVPPGWRESAWTRAKKRRAPLGGARARGVPGQEAGREAAPAPFAVEEPGPAQMVAEWFAQEPGAMPAAAGGAPARLERLLGRDAGRAVVRGEVVEPGGEFFQDPVHAVLRVREG